ncbi:MAG: MarR family transcriptional regulator [Lentilitoribacter sp.]
MDPQIEQIKQASETEMINRVWFNLMRAHRNLFPKIQAELKKNGMKSPLWHEILLKIEEAGQTGITASELLPQLYMSQFNLSRHLSRLEKDGLIVKVQDDKDKRISYLKITDKGKTLNHGIWPIYEKIIQEELKDRFTKDEAFELFKGLIKLYP